MASGRADARWALLLRRRPRRVRWRRRACIWMGTMSLCRGTTLTDVAVHAVVPSPTATRPAAPVVYPAPLLPSAVAASARDAHLFWTGLRPLHRANKIGTHSKICGWPLGDRKRSISGFIRSVACLSSPGRESPRGREIMSGARPVIYLGQADRSGWSKLKRKTSILFLLTFVKCFTSVN